jgi:hypothetical protein
MPPVPTPLVHAAPRSVRVAGVLVAVQGLAGLAYAVAVLVRALGETKGAGNVYGEAGYFAVLAFAVLAVASGLLLGNRWARTPATVLQLLLIAVAWYAIGPSHQVVAGVGVAVLCVGTLVLLFTARARAWAVEAG